MFKNSLIFVEKTGNIVILTENTRFPSVLGYLHQLKNPTCISCSTSDFSESFEKSALLEANPVIFLVLVEVLAPITYPKC